MKYKDRIYGQVNIKKPVILEIIKSSSFRRLKGIDQAGYPSLCYNPYLLPLSQIKCNRFQHSLGVFILLNKINASPEEQIAGLIHDISHSAFSHCIDYILDEGSEKEHNYQDNIFEEFIKKTEIPNILEKYNFDLDYILNENNFPFLEKKLPDLCADRIDYSLRTAYHFGEINRDALNSILDNLIISNDYWVFKDYKNAEKFANLFLRIARDYYSGLASAIMFKTVGDTMKYALEKGYISKDDLYTTDREVLNKIKNNLKKDQKLNSLFRRMNNKVKFENNLNDYEVNVFCKSRVVDPLFIKKDSLIRLSEVDNKWVDIIKQESQPKEYYIKFFD